MGIGFWNAIRGKNGKARYEEVEMEKMISAAVELNIRILAVNVCVNMIANAVSRCEFKTLKAGKEVKEHEYYMLNVEPNINQNSTMFWHKVIYKLCTENEVLIVSVTHRDGHEMLVVADEFDKPEEYPRRMNEYENVKVGKEAPKTYKEKDVLHLQLNQVDIAPILERLYGTYSDLLQAAKKSYTRSKGVRLKVKVEEVPDGDENYAATFKKLMDDQVKPWVEADSGVLPQFQGYEYTDMGSNKATETTQDFRSLVNDIFAFTAKGYGIPPVLVNGEVEGTKDAMNRWLTTGIDPLCDQAQEELNRKRYGYEEWVKGNRIHVDSSTITHFDLFANATSVEKLIGSGAFSINDVLAAAGQPEIDETWANQHWLTLNFEDIQQAAKNAGKGGE